MSKVNKVQTYAICWLHSLNKSSIEIADELKLTEKQVVGVLEKHTFAKNDTTEETIKTATSSVAPKITPKDLMITHTSAKKTNSVSIMTKEASELGDDMRKKHIANQIPDAQKGIFRPNKK